MSPLEAFHDWLRKQPDEADTEIALGIEDLLMPPGTPMGDDPIGAVERWNEFSALDTTTVIGRAVSIRAIVEHQFGRRFTGNNWALAKLRTERMREQRIAEGRGEDTILYDEALPKIPERRRMWRDVGIVTAHRFRRMPVFSGEAVHC